MTAQVNGAKTITVFGGSGYVGSHLVQRLANQGWRVRVAVRRPHEAPQLRTMGDVGQVQIVQANVRDAASVNAAAQGADVVVNLVGLTLQAGKQKFRAVHAAGAGNVARGAAAAGAKKMIHLSALGADKDGTSAFAQTKAAGEDEVREAYPDATLVRPGPIFGPDDRFIARLANVIRLTPVVPMIGMGATKFQPIHINDVVDALMAMIGSDEAAGKIYELGGPDVLSLAEIKKMIAAEQDRPRLFVPWPFALAKINGFFLQLTYTFLRIPPLLTADQVEFLKTDLVCGQSGEDGVLGTADLDIGPLISFEAVLSNYMMRFRKYGQFDEQTA
jgi:NADH dehydrogenase